MRARKQAGLPMRQVTRTRTYTHGAFNCPRAPPWEAESSLTPGMVFVSAALLTHRFRTPEMYLGDQWLCSQLLQPTSASPKGCAMETECAPHSLTSIDLWGFSSELVYHLGCGFVHQSALEPPPPQFMWLNASSPLKLVPLPVFF